MSKILAIETATEACSAALYLEGELTVLHQIAPRQHTDLLLPMIDQLMIKSNIALKEIDFIAVSCGPGSFMGLRLGVGVAQGLAFGLGISVIPISTLQTLAQCAYTLTGESRILAGWDARMGELYWGDYELNEKGVMMPIIADQLQSPEQFSMPKYPGLAVGNAWSIYGLEVPQFNTLVYPSAAAVAQLASTRLEAAVLPALVEPSYLRNQVATPKNSEI